MKKAIALLVAVLLLAALCAGCAEKEPADISVDASDDDPIGGNTTNPLTETTMDGIMNTIGFYFGVPANAKDLQYFLIRDEIGEMRFTCNGAKMTARIASAVEFTDISGIYTNFDPALEEDVEIGGIAGKLQQGKLDDKTVELCQWYDVVPGVMYSLSAEGADLDGFDITAVADEVYLPMQKDVG